MHVMCVGRAAEAMTCVESSCTKERGGEWASKLTDVASTTLLGNIAHRKHPSSAHTYLGMLCKH
jgi:hypothetical protein